MTRPKNLYLIGPITGIENNNRDEFERVRELLERCITAYSDCKPEDPNTYFACVFIPHDVVDENASWEICMMDSISEMLSTRVDTDPDEPTHRTPYFSGVAMLDGWEGSRGARIEHDLASALGIPCKPWREWLELLQ